VTSYNLPVSTTFTSPAELDNLFIQSINDYVAEFSFVKLEASLTDMVYM